MADFYTESQQQLQARYGTEPLAAAHEATIVSDTIPEEHALFISSRDYFFLSSVNDKGEPTVSYKGGAPGFVRVVDEKTLLFPSYDGNGMFLSMGNIAATGKIGMLFMDFETPHRVRVQATASVHTEGELLESYPGAQLLVEARVDSAFINCARYIHPHQRVSSSPYVPDAEGNQPYPAWKRIEELQPVLPEADQGRAEKVGGTISVEE